MPNTQYSEIIAEAARNVHELGTTRSDKLDQLILVISTGQNEVLKRLSELTGMIGVPASRAGRLQHHARTAIPWSVFGGFITWLAQVIVAHVR